MAGGLRLGVEVGNLTDDCVAGASVCVSGVCLTVAAFAGKEMEFDVIAETLEKSTLGLKRVGDRVNLERSLQIGGRLDGHFVQGHVDGKASVTRIDKSSRQCVVHLRLEPQLMPYIVPKGSVAVDGVSLTIAEVDGDAFSIALIPTTLERTTLSSLGVGDLINIETDIIARTLVHHLTGMTASRGVSLESLHQAGFA